MAFEIRVDEQMKCIFVTFSGALTMRVIHEYLEELLPILHECPYRRLLSDCSRVEVRLSSMDILQLPKFAAASPLTQDLKRAVLATPGTSGYELYETLSSMAGQQLRVFSRRDAAMEWLFEDDAGG